MRLLSEQGAIPLDQLARFLGARSATAVGAASRASRTRAASSTAASWFAITHGSGPAVAAPRSRAPASTTRVPDVAILAHRRAVNEVRLHLAARAPQGRWLCERIVYRRRDPNDHLPDAVFEIDGERHAIEAELSRKRHREIRRIVAEHSNRYDAVLYFCGPATYNHVEAGAGRGALAEAGGPPGAGGRAMLRGRRQPMPPPPPPPGGRRPRPPPRRRAGAAAEWAEPALALRADAPPRGDPRRLRHRQDRDLDANRLRAGHQDRCPGLLPRRQGRSRRRGALQRVDARGRTAGPGLPERALRRLARRLARDRQSPAWR